MQRLENSENEKKGSLLKIFPGCPLWSGGPEPKGQPGQNRSGCPWAPPLWSGGPEPKGQPGQNRSGCPLRSPATEHKATPASGGPGWRRRSIMAHMRSRESYTRRQEQDASGVARYSFDPGGGTHLHAPTHGKIHQSSQTFSKSIKFDS